MWIAGDVSAFVLLNRKKMNIALLAAMAAIQTLMRKEKEAHREAFFRFLQKKSSAIKELCLENNIILKMMS